MDAFEVDIQSSLKIRSDKQDMESSIVSLEGFREILILSILPEFIDRAKFYEILKDV